MKTLAIITARGGSKRIPGKNIRDFYGKPVIAYSIQAALESNCFDKIMCSTDDVKIAKIAQKYGAEVPFFRSPETSTDYATTADVWQEVISEYAKRGEFFDCFCCIYPVAPFISGKQLKAGLNIMLNENANGAMPVVQYSYPTQRALKISSQKLSMFYPDFLTARSQDLEKSYHDAGQFYWYKTEAFHKNPNIMQLSPVAIILPENEVQDIDTEEDWQIAELKYKILQGKLL